MKSSRLVAALAVATGSAWACTATPPAVAPIAPTVASSSDSVSAPVTGSASASVSVSAPVSAPVSVAVSVTGSVTGSATATATASATGIAIGPGTRVFLFGDSMVTAGLGQRLEKLTSARGAKYAENHWSSSTTKKWSESERLPNLLFKNKPDVVFIVIGSNEVYYLDKHVDEHIKAIVKKLGGKPCVWIGPPVWKKQTGIVDAERDNSAPCAFFDSSSLQLDRQPDGIHPSLKGGAQWAEAVWAATVAP